MNQLSKKQRFRLARRIIPIQVLSGLVLASFHADALAEDEFYIWQDDTGQTHYSSRLPKDRPAESVRLGSSSTKVQPTEHIYTWIDAKGHVYYGAKPPAGMPVKELLEEDSSLSTIHQGKLRHGEQRLLQHLP
ncbi:MAG: hypothetical protein CSA09_03070 [Candidatus Contendobacter odensis]|uniref:DUF4124 domain-containing protein n=1 Tax=Candidatus Contendibacter odensensis TaxID=1400860 RepID=A0A2G6PET9_9GAMM|nr:MAG: hypothetical protein CSA09_03070 [Candidatus Contendobacter odensis]